MNVRFFGGRKEEYVSIPKHNPIGLYFCADTRELFLGDRLLSDGLRVVATFADLPSISEHKAAEGVIYFVADTKNGYVLPRGGNDWLQVIYAPTAGEGAEVDLSDYYTKAEVDEAILKAIANIEINVDLSGYATKEEVVAIEAKIPSLEGYAKAEDVSAEIKAAINEIEIPEVPTKVSELENDAGYLIEHQDLSEYAKKSELPVIDGLASEEFVIKKIAEAELADQDVDLSVYYTKAEVDALIPEVPTKASELENDAGYLTESNIFYIDSLDINDTIISLLQKVKSGESVTVYVKYFDTYSPATITTKESIIEFSSSPLPCYSPDRKYIMDMYTKYTYTYDNTGWKCEQSFPADLLHYATQFEIERLQEQVDAINIPEAEIYKVDFNAPDYAKAVDAYNSGKVLVLANAAPDANGYAMMNYVSEKYITFTKFLTSRSEAYGSFNTYYLSPANTWEVSKEVKLNKVEANAEGEVNGELTSIRIGKEVYSLPSTDGLASTDYVDKAIAGVKVPDVSNFVTMEQVEAKGYITDVPAEYITETELEAKGFITEHIDISGKADKDHSHSYNDLTDKPEIPSIEGLATEDFVKAEIEKIDLPTVDTSKFVTTEVLNGVLAEKADTVLFTSSKFVTNAIGSFTEGEDVKDFTIAELFAKLLGLSDEKPGTDEPDEPELPEEPNSIVETILYNKTPMYQINDSDEMTEVAYELLTYSSDTVATTRDNQTGFYKAVNENGEILEAGYQHYSTAKDPYYIVALPEDLVVAADGNTEMHSWNTMVQPNRWTEVGVYTLTDDYAEIVATYNADGIEPPVAPEGYKLWADLSRSDPGSALRFVIKE